MDHEWLAQLPIQEPIISWQPVSGGDINKAFRLETATKTYFVNYAPNKFGGL